MLYQRKIYPLLLDHLAKKQITIITGMRRTGKTTLAKLLLDQIPDKNKLYLDLERLDIRELFQEKNYDNILQALSNQGLNINKKITLALDEIQLAPQSTSVIKYLYDHYNIKFIVTGSSSFYLKNLFSESLSGRKKIFELFPLDFGEYLTFKNISYRRKKIGNIFYQTNEYHRLKNYYQDYLLWGGFPEVVLAAASKEKNDLLADILNSYFQIDVASLADLKNERNLYHLLKMLASRIGTRLDVSKISRLTGLSRPTITNYLEFLEKTYIISRVPVYTNNPDWEIVKAQKLYFTDNGLAATLARLNSGSLLENAVYNQLKNLGSIQYYSLKSGQEIDFILNKKICLEVKETPTIDDWKKLKNISQNIKLNKFYLIGKQPTPKFSNFIWAGDIY